MQKAKIGQWLKMAKAETSLREVGDAARDKGQWADAEASYRAHLVLQPDDFDIWVQFGHSLKEQGKMAEAEAAYQKAITIRPEDADVYLQLGHLLKQVGKPLEATEAYRQSFSYNPSKDAFTELSILDPDEFNADISLAASNNVLVGDAIFIEIDDLFNYLEAHKTLSGIQRVQVAVIQHVLAASASQVAQPIVFVLNPPDAEYLWAIEASDLRQLANYVTGPNVSHDRLKKIVTRARSQAAAVTPTLGQTYLILGAFWGYASVAARYFRLKRSGVSIGAFIYDLIPLTHAEFCDDGLSHDFALSFGDGMAVFDFVLTISEFTAKEVRKYRERVGLPPMPIMVVPLAHANAVVVAGKSHTWSSQIKQLQGKQFALMVSTIEARKNHAYLVAAWKQFVDEGLDPPDLVFVGRFGWRVTNLMETLRTLHYLDNRIHIVHDLTDSDLGTLYGACLFTLFPSFVEGWGLPVGESLAYGKPCVASSTSSIPEVGGDVVDYLDPQNLRDGVDIIRKMTFDSDYRERRTRDVQEKFQFRSWQEVGADLLSKVEQLRQQIQLRQVPEVLFPEGRVFRISQLAFGHKLPRDYARRPWRLILTDSWYGFETFGCWMRGSRANVAFRTELPPGTRIIVYLQFCAPSWVRDEHRLSLILENDGPDSVAQLDGSVAKSTQIQTDQAFLASVSGHVHDSGVVTVSIEVTGHIPNENSYEGSRRFVVGLKAVGYASHSNAVARLDIMEDFAQHLV